MMKPCRGPGGLYSHSCKGPGVGGGGCRWGKDSSGELQQGKGIGFGLGGRSDLILHLTWEGPRPIDSDVFTDGSPLEPGQAEG